MQFGKGILPAKEYLSNGLFSIQNCYSEAESSFNQQLHFHDFYELSLIYEGRFHTFSPKTYLDRTELSVIRPLMYVTEAEVIGFKNKYQLPVCKNPCPADGRTKREFVKQLANQLNREAPGVKERLFHAVQAGGIDGWKEV